jgi:hypothetical protein
MQTPVTLTCEKISRRETIVLNEPVDNVFPLFGPLREKEWAYGWNPEIISGEGEIEEYMVFKTDSKYDDEPEYRWILSQYCPAEYMVEYTVTAKDRTWFINVKCNGLAGATEAMISYTYIGFTALACKRNFESLSKMYSANLKDWEEAINYYLSSGKQLKP